MGEAKQKAKKGIAVSKPAYVKLANEVAAIADIDPKLTPKKTTSQIVGAAIKKRGRPAKVHYEVSPKTVEVNGEIITYPVVTEVPKRYKRTMTIPKLTEPIRDRKLKDLLKAISRDGAIGNDRSLQKDVDAIKRLFT